MSLDRSDILSTAEFAALTGRRPQSIRRERMRGDGPPYFSIGTRKFYFADDVRAWMESRKARSTCEFVHRDGD